MLEIWANSLLQKAVKSCPKCKKSPTLVTLEGREGGRRIRRGGDCAGSEFKRNLVRIENTDDDHDDDDTTERNGRFPRVGSTSIFDFSSFFGRGMN